jgi:hypothetical protein
MIDEKTINKMELIQNNLQAPRRSISVKYKYYG